MLTLEMEPLKISSQSSATQMLNLGSESALILKRTSSSSKRPSIEFDFLGSEQRGEQQNWSVSQILPVFNTDKKYYTPTFILNIDKPKYETRHKLYLSLHRDRVQSNLDQETSNLRVPRPYEFHSYCMVCKRDFHDYQKHIQSESHHSKMLKSQFCQDIDNLCASFGNKPDHRKENFNKMKKTKKIRKVDKTEKWIQNVETKCQFESIY